MLEVINAKIDEIFDITNEIFKNNGTAKIRVTGNSMLPFLRDGLDTVELCSIDFQDIKKADIVLILRESGQYVLHRVIRKDDNCFYLNGDAQLWIEGPINPDQLIAKVINIWHKDRKISCISTIWRLFSRVWMLLFPLRSFIFKLYLSFKGLYRKIKNMEKAK